MKNNSMVTLIDKLSEKNRKVQFFSFMLFFMMISSNTIGYSIDQNNGVFASINPVKGVVKDNKGSALVGVSIVMKGSIIGTTTNAEGKFTINLPDGETPQSLVFSFVGYKSQEVAVNKSNTINVVLLEDASNLSEVVVMGYGSQQKKDITGSVSVISAKEYVLQPVNRLDQILQGRTAGVQITNNSGAPGGDVKIRIRGANSISGGNEPLYVIDGFIGADFRNLNTEDIESIQVLKDASATAIYGSRGANGVIVVTTKRGNNEKASISFTARYGISSAIKKYDLLSASDYAETVNARNVVLGLRPTFSANDVQNYRASGGTNWQDEIFRQAASKEYLIGVGSGTAKTNYYLSGNYQTQDGIVVNSGFKRYGFRANINSNITDKLSVRVIASGNRRENLNSQVNAGKNSAITQALSWAPTTPVRNALGNYTASDPTGSIFQNPSALANEVRNINSSTSANILSGLNYEIINGLTLDVSYGINFEAYQGENFTGTTASGNNQASAYRASFENTLWQNSNNLTYKKVFNQIHSFTATAVYEVQSFQSKGFATNASNLTFPALGADNLSNINDGGATASTGYYSNYGLTSFLGRINYAYNDKYLVTATVRQDASSKFKGANRSSIFPSIGLGWRISEENFIKNTNAFNNLKLRFGYGLTGNQGINPYGTFSNYNSDAYSAGTPFNSNSVTSGIILGNPGNPNLKWETTQQANLGLDVELRNGISLTMDYFIKNTSDLLLYQPVPNFAGGGTIPSNIGKMKNQGIEISLNATPVNKKDFVWETSFNFSYIKNEVVSLGSQDRIFTGSNVGSGLSTQSEFILTPGQALGSLWGVKYLGTWKPSENEAAKKFGAKAGDSRYEDVNNDGKIDGADFQIIGNGMPKTSIGWNNTFNISKSWSVNIFVQSLMNFDKLNYLYGVTVAPTADVRQATHVDIKDRYIPGTNETSNIPAFSSTDKTYLQSSRFVQRGDFVRIKNVSVNYELPKNLLKGFNVSLFGSVTNLLTITNYKGFDPESSSVTSNNDVDQGIDYGSYPNSKTYTLGISLKF